MPEEGSSTHSGIQLKLFYSPASPYVRKVMVCAIERGLDARVEKLASAANPINQDAGIKAHNPAGKVPAISRAAAGSRRRRRGCATSRRTSRPTPSANRACS